MVTVPILGTDLCARHQNPNPSPLVEMSHYRDKMRHTISTSMVFIKTKMFCNYIPSLVFPKLISLIFDLILVDLTVMIGI